MIGNIFLALAGGILVLGCSKDRIDPEAPSSAQGGAGGGAGEQGGSTGGGASAGTGAAGAPGGAGGSTTCPSNQALCKGACAPLDDPACLPRTISFADPKLTAGGVALGNFGQLVDVSGDGVLDYAGLTLIDPKIPCALMAWKGNKDGTFLPDAMLKIPFANQCSELTTFDLKHDGTKALAAVADATYIVAPSPSGAYAVTQTTPVVIVYPADFDGDGFDDLLAAPTPNDKSWTVRFNDKSGHLVAPVSIGAFANATAGLAPVRFRLPTGADALVFRAANDSLPDTIVAGGNNDGRIEPVEMGFSRHRRG